MTFKKTWEKSTQHTQLPVRTIEEMVQIAFPLHQLVSYELIAGGCANLNIKIQVSRQQKPYILRVYLREPDAAYRERKLSELLKQDVPVPQTYFIGEHHHRFAITEFIEGITLRDLLLGKETYSLGEIMYAAGQYLGKIQCHHFLESGFFNNNLEIAPQASTINLAEFAENCLLSTSVIDVLGVHLVKELKQYIKKFQSYFPDEHANHLVHADYDPANILVAKKNSQWEITGILDWEFSFSGSPLFDVANMLRYAHQMPKLFTQAFLQGVEEKFTLPPHWTISILLLNLVSLLDCLMRNTPQQKPNQCADICALIRHMTQKMKQF